MNRMWLLAGVAAILLGWQAYGCEQRRQGELVERIGVLEEQRDALLRRSHAVDTLYRRDTVALTRWKDHYHTVRDTVTLTDTVNVRNVLFIADSTILSCSNALETCEHRVAVRDSLLSNQRSEIQLLLKRHPSRFGCAGPFAATTRGLGLGVACGIKF